MSVAILRVQTPQLICRFSWIARKEERRWDRGGDSGGWKYAARVRRCTIMGWQTQINPSVTESLQHGVRWSRTAPDDQEQIDLQLYHTRGKKAFTNIFLLGQSSCLLIHIFFIQCNSVQVRIPHIPRQIITSSSLNFSVRSSFEKQQLRRGLLLKSYLESTVILGRRVFQAPEL